MRNRRWICLLLAVLMVLACTACGAKANNGASGDVRTLTDGKNRTVEVPKQVERVVCVGVGALRYSCYVGAADRAVGVEDYETKAGEIFTELLGSNPYPDLKEAGYAFRAITIGE